MKDKSVKIGFPTTIVREGQVNFFAPRLEAFVSSSSDYAPSKAPVFFNPIMELNRDIAVLALQSYQKMVNRPIFVCEPLTGCGIRGIRFAVEVDGVKESVINDINEKAFKLSCYNVNMNGLGEQIVVKNEDANFLLCSHGMPRKRFDAVDIDPFGSPVIFLDSAVRALRNNGFLALTATDMAPLCGVHEKACMRKYGGKSLRTEYCHELAIRVLAGTLAKTAAKYELGTRIVFSHSANHYIRLYAIVRCGAKEADKSINKLGYVLHCFKCFHRETINRQSLSRHSMKCCECGSKMNIAGPLWLGDIFEKDFCRLMEAEAKQRIFRLGKKIHETLTIIASEAEAPITYYVLDRLCKAIVLPVPSVKTIVMALREEDHQASFTHFNSRGIRSDASAAKMKEILQNNDRLSGKF